ncbi:MAG TPA: hypothetical protein VFW33_07465, partial [Gemmataceae bacterium]|nr:hypothetical protein [Gemmataceae bacterium]
ITDYWLSDCDGCGALYDRVSGQVPAELMAHWAEYLTAVARMELRGINALAYGLYRAAGVPAPHAADVPKKPTSWGRLCDTICPWLLEARELVPPSAAEGADGRLPRTS